MDNQITLCQALKGYLLYADASRLSPCTIAAYTNTFHKFQLANSLCSGLRALLAPLHVDVNVGEI